VRNQQLHNFLKEYCEAALSFIKANVKSKDDLPLTPVPEFEFTETGYSITTSMKINWMLLVVIYERAFKGLPACQKAVQALEADEIIAKQLNVLVGTNSGLRNLNTDDCLRSLLITYLNEQEKIQSDIFSKIYEKMEDYFYQDIIPFRYLAPLSNFKMESERVELKPGFSITKLTLEERVSILSRVYGMDALTSHASYQGLIESSKYALECLQEEPKVIGQRSEIDPTKFAYHKVIQNFESAVATLRLYKSGSISYAHVIENSDTWNPVGGTMHSPQFLYPPSIFGITYELTNSEIPGFVEFWRKFEQAQINGKAIKTALSRFSFVYERGRPEDRLIDYIISLEALLLENEPELRYKFSLRGSALLGEDDPKKRATIFYELYEGYGQRNNIAHGNIPKQSLTVGSETLQFPQLVENVGNHARSTIRTFILLRKSKKQILEMLNQKIIEGFSSTEKTK
jgi:hypothetical protein